MAMQFNNSGHPQLISLLEDAIDFAIYIIAVDPDSPYGGRVVMVSPSVVDIVGIRDPQRFETWFENLHPDDAERVIEANRRAWTHLVRYDEVARFYHRQKDRWVWVRTISTPVCDPHGQVSHFTGVIFDVTDQKLAELEEIRQRQEVEASLWISQALYSEVFDHSPLQMFIIEVLPDGKFRVVRTNPTHQRESGLPPDRIWGKTVEELVIPQVAAAINRHYRECVETGCPVEYEEQGPSPYWNLERIRTFRTTLAPVFDEHGNVVRLIGASQDITEQKQAEQVLMDRARAEAVLRERGRLARDLHDAVTQTLFSATLTAEVLPKIWDRDPAEGRRKLEELRELTRGALAEMRTLLLELRPDALAESDLKDLLRHLSNAFNARARIPIHTSIEGACDLPLDGKIAFYRVAQEALNNIAKHSQATRVSLVVRCRPGSVNMQVSDDGQGFDPGAVGTRDHFGLRIMRERAEQVGARFEIRSQPRQGTQIFMDWQPPLDADEEEKS